VLVDRGRRFGATDSASAARSGAEMAEREGLLCSFKKVNTEAYFATGRIVRTNIVPRR
jgi:hypothetical protein